MDMLLIIPVLLFSVIAHEVAHGYAAYQCGDATAKYSGRLTFNPLPHVDLFGTIIFPIMLIITNSHFLIGWAKPVPINPNNFRRPRRDDIFVSLSGIIVNLGLALIFTFFLGVCISFIVILSSPSGDAILKISYLGKSIKALLTVLPRMFFYGMSINVLLAVFNLLPIPPLDGSWVLYHLLPQNLADAYKKIFPYGFMILLLLVMTGTITKIIMPINNFLLAFLQTLLPALANT